MELLLIREVLFYLFYLLHLSIYLSIYLSLVCMSLRMGYFAKYPRQNYGRV